MAFINPQIDIAFAALLLALVSQFIQRKFVDKQKLKESQEKMKQAQKRMKELASRQDNQSKQEMERIEKEFMQTAGETMQASMKQLAVSTPIFLLAFLYLGGAYEKDTIQLPVPLPWFGNNGIQLFSETSWVGWYVVSALASTLILNVIIKIFDTVKKK